MRVNCDGAKALPLLTYKAGNSHMRVNCDADPRTVAGAGRTGNSRMRVNFDAKSSKDRNCFYV